MIIAVDFDGTLCKHRFPEIGPENQPLIDFLIELKEGGHILILWTCRENIRSGPRYLDEAVAWCLDHGLEFDAVNQNCDDLGGFASRKIYADLYIDDRAIECSGDDIVEQLKKRLGND